jgi:hypothetical protein
MAVTYLVVAAPAFAQTTVSFQQGAGGYMGTLDIVVGPVTAGVPDFGNILGSTMQEQFLDGRYYDVDPAGGNGANEDEKQLLIRFDEIFGDAPGQIPANAHIQSASLVLTTGATSGDARSGGPYGVAQLLMPFSDLTSWFDLLDVGATFASGAADRPLDRGFRGPMEASTIALNPQTADVTRVVQNWADGQANEGFVVRAGATDGWQIFMTGASLVESRPRLEITYDTAPRPEIETAVLQYGAENYFDVTMVRLDDDDITNDGTLFDLEFLDGGNLAGTSPDDQALIQFDGIFASQGGPVPDDAFITESFLVLDTAPATRSLDAGTNGNFAVHQMLVDWDLSSVYSGFGADGPDEAEGEVGPPLDLTGAMIADARTHLDVTDAVRNWQAGEPNFGLNVQAADTADGWAIHWLGSDSPPQLVINYTDAPPPEDLPGDYNGNGTVEQADLDLVLLNWGQSSVPAGWTNDLPDGNIDQSELDGVLLNWGNVVALGASAGVPEPSAWILCVATLTAIAATSRRQLWRACGGCSLRS